MNPKRLGLWGFINEPEEVVCPNCKESNPVKDWEEGGKYCEDCRDDHLAIVCPNCEEAFNCVEDVELIEEVN